MQVVVVALVVWVALGVSHFDVLNIPVARAVRWAMLGLFVLLSLLYAATARPLRPARLPAAVMVATAGFCGVATLSALWSVAPALTLGRALTLDALLGGAAAVAIGTKGSARATGQILLALLAGTALVAAAGVVAVALGDERATQPATLGTPVRFNGLGGNPNTMALLLAVALPLAAWAFSQARSRPGKALAALTFVLFDGSVAASGSRGAILASFAGLAALAVTLPVGRRRRLALLAAAVMLLAANAVITQIPNRADRDPITNLEFGIPTPIAANDAQFILPLESEIGWELHTKRRIRGLFETSGRLIAWRGGLSKGADRPLLGYGFGTEERVFVDRFYLFIGDRVENSYLATALQLGVVGLGLLIGLLAAIATAGARGLRSGGGEHRAAAAACASVAVAAVALAIVQSFLTSVGSPPTAPAWIAALLLAALGGEAARRRSAGLERDRDEQ